MDDLGKELRDILGHTLDLPPLSDAEAVRFILEMKALQKPGQPPSDLVGALEEAWHRAAAPDMKR